MHREPRSTPIAIRLAPFVSAMLLLLIVSVLPGHAATAAAAATTPAIAAASAETVTSAALPAGISVGDLPDAASPDPASSHPASDPTLMNPAFPNHPGWPVAVQGGASPPVCADLDPLVPGLETVVGSLTTAQNLYVFHQDGSPMSGYPIDLGYFIAASPSIGDIDADGRLEIVVGDWGGNQVWALNADGTPLPGWPIPVGGNVRSTAALADLDPTFPGLEVIVGVQDGTVQAWHADGSRVPGWPVQAGNFVERCAPAVGDVDGDGHLEVFVGSWYDGNPGSTGGVYGFHHDGTPLAGWPKLTATHTSVIASAALADLDSDHNLEIIVGTYETAGKIYVWHHDGSDMSGWPYTIPRGTSSTSLVSASPAVGDIDGDGALEIVCGSAGQCGTVYAWNRGGTVIPGWPALVNAVVDGSSPVLADVDADGGIEIVIGSGSGFTPFGCTAGAISKAYVLRANGTVMPGWPLDLGTATTPSPAVADIDDDGNVEVVMAFSQSVYAWDAPGAWNARLTPWPFYHLGCDHTGWFRAIDPAAVETGAPVRDATVALWPNPARPGQVVRINAAGRLSVVDAGGRVLRVLSGSEWDGTDAVGRPVPAGTYYIRGARGAGSRLVVLD
jgi:hypothetical protein